MTRDTMELADKCEAAEGAGRALDAEIALALGIVRERDGDCFYGHRDYSVLVLERGYYDHDGNAPELPHYTGSLDAASTLVPSGWQWTITDYQGAAPAIAVLGNKLIIRNATTPALALCAAALKARAMGDGEG